MFLPELRRHKRGFLKLSCDQNFYASSLLKPLHLPSFPPACLPSLQMFLPELRRHKRGFLKLTCNQTFMRVTDAAAAQRMFIGYLKDQLAQQG